MRMLLDIVRQSLATLWAHKLRSFLTMFGIAWGDVVHGDSEFCWHYQRHVTRDQSRAPGSD